MSVYEKIYSKMGKQKLHMTLIDPATSGVQGSVKIAEQAERAGTDFILIGGSTNLSISEMDNATGAIKSRIETPVIIFPGSASMFTKLADAIFFMSLLNSRDREFIIDHQIKASRIVRQSGIESISMGYLIFEPGMTVGRVGKANLIGREDETLAVQYSLAAELLGMSIVYLEAGSGADKHISCDVVRAVKSNAKIPIIVGGGIRNEESSREIAQAGADIVVTGTITERTPDVYSKLKPIIESVKNSA